VDNRVDTRWITISTDVLASFDGAVIITWLLSVLNKMEYFVYQVNSNSSPDITGEKPTPTFLYDGAGRRKYLTAAERNAFLRVARTLPDEHRTFCLTLAYTGARISEALFLIPKQIDRPAQCIVYETLKRRRRGIFRAVPIPADFLSELERVHQLHVIQLDPVLCAQRIWPWCRTTAWHVVKECMTSAGIEGPHTSPKGLRHSFAVNALQAGVPINLVRKWLGHARLSTTEIYADAIGEEEQAIADRFWKTFQT